MGNSVSKPAELYKTLDSETLARCIKATNFTEQQIRNSHKKFFHHAENGKLKKNDLQDLLGDYIPDGKRKHVKYLTDSIYSAMDTNNDGFIDFFEYLMSIKFFQTESPMERAVFIFRVIDKNGDNLISKKEIERILKCFEDYYKNSSDPNIANIMKDGIKTGANSIFEKLDEDRSGLVAISEFVDAWLKDETLRTLFSF